MLPVSFINKKDLKWMNFGGLKIVKLAFFKPIAEFHVDIVPFDMEKLAHFIQHMMALTHYPYLHINIQLFSASALYLIFSQG